MCWIEFVFLISNFFYKNFLILISKKFQLFPIFEKKFQNSIVNHIWSFIIKLESLCSAYQFAVDFHIKSRYVIFCHITLYGHGSEIPLMEFSKIFAIMNYCLISFQEVTSSCIIKFKAQHRMNKKNLSDEFCNYWL